MVDQLVFINICFTGTYSFIPPAPVPAPGTRHGPLQGRRLGGNKTARQTEILKKELCKIFQANGLQITIEASSKIVDFLDFTLNLNDGTYKPYMKPNNRPLYVHKESNHPPGILKNIPLATNRRISSISSSEKIFNAAAPDYQEALGASGYDHKLKYEPQNRNNQNRKRNRKRQVTYFNPPCSQNVATNIGKQFSQALDSSFPPGHPLTQIVKQKHCKTILQDHA